MEPYMQQFQGEKNRISVIDWLVSIFVASIPLIGIVMLLVWAFSGDTPETKANWAKAMLLMTLIAIVFGVIMMVIFGSLFFWKDVYIM
ncbi:MAG TPA: hypothetical protein VK014_03845 [Cyclobacteriaceae bacterium]|nr:hypothetical protein [Cyclobacteriaceae bacterium]